MNGSTNFKDIGPFDSPLKEYEVHWPEILVPSQLQLDPWWIQRKSSDWLHFRGWLSRAS